MTGEKKTSDLTSRLSVKRGGRLLSKTSKPASGTISSPPKAAIAASNSRKDDIPRHRNALNDILRRRGGDGAVTGRDTSPPLQHVQLGNAAQPSEEGTGVDAKMVERVAELDRVLVFAKEEQASLREELKKMREHEQNDGVRQQVTQEQGDGRQSPASETIGEEGVKSSGPDHNRKDLATLGNDRLSDVPHDILRQNYDLQYKLAQLQDQLVSQNVAYRNNLERALSHSDAEWHDLRSRLHATEKESQERLQQLLSLKSSISSLTRSESQTTDRELAESFTQLANRIREWIISNYRRSKLDIGDLPSETVKVLRSLTSAYQTIESTDRFALYQALVSKALMQILEEPIILGLPTTGPFGEIRHFAEYIQNTGTEYRDWRRVTVRAVERSEALAHLQQERNKLLSQMAEGIAHLLFTLTSINLTSNAHSALMGILNVAADLQRTLVLQKARYQVLFFRDEESGRDLGFDEHRMESINDLDNTADDDTNMANNHQFLFCVFPCLEKFGDERGEHLEVSNVLLKARVCCGVG